MFRQACKMTMTCFQQSFFCYRHTFIFREQKLSLSTARNVQLVKRTFQLQKFFSQPKSAFWCIFFDSLTGCTNGLYYNRIEIFVFQPLNSMLKELFQKSNMLVEQNELLKQLLQKGKDLTIRFFPVTLIKNLLETQ